MEVKILCACGSKYKFDVEPLHGKLPGPVACPTCGADGTDKGNEIVARNLQAAIAAAPMAPMRVGSPTSASVPAGETEKKSGMVVPQVPRSSREAAAMRVDAPPATPRTSQPGALVPAPPNPASAKRLSVAGDHAAAPAAAADQPEAPAPAPVRAAPDRGIPEGGPSFVRGLAGIGIASVVGLIGWFAATSVLTRKLGWLAIGVGAMIGWAAQWMGREKSARLGAAAAIATVFVMAFGTVWSARHEAMIEADAFLREMYDEHVAYAQEAVKARTDDEIKELILEAPAESFDETEEEDAGAEFEKVAFQEVTAKDISDWKRKELPELRKYAEGKVTRTQYERDRRPFIETMFSAGFVMHRAFRISMLVWIGLGVAAAWQIATRKG